MPKVLCFNCGRVFEVKFGIKNPTKQCLDCRDGGTNV
jgi:hypothetical protein